MAPTLRERCPGTVLVRQLRRPFSSRSSLSFSPPFSSLRYSRSSLSLSLPSQRFFVGPRDPATRIHSVISSPNPIILLTSQTCASQVPREKHQRDEKKKNLILKQTRGAAGIQNSVTFSDFGRTSPLSLRHLQKFPGIPMNEKKT